jgi:ASCH domain
MKALSLRQPWAWLVVHGGKTIENRRWDTQFRGDFLIHAAKGCTKREHEDAALFAEDASPRSTRLMPAWKDTPRSGIVGIARLSSIVPPRGEGLRFYPSGVNPAWHMPDQYGFVLEDIRPLRFVPCVGMLGFFTPEQGVLAALKNQLDMRGGR